MSKPNEDTSARSGRNLHLTHTDPRDDPRILKEMEALSEAGYAVTAIGVQSTENSAELPQPAFAVCQVKTLQARRLRWLPRTLRHIVTLIELMAKVIPAGMALRPQIIHCHDTLVLPIGVLLKLLTGANLVYDAHELESDKNGLTKLQSQLTLRAERLMWRFVDGLITPSPSISDWYQQTVGDKPVVTILNSPLIEGVDRFSGQYLREKFAIPQDAVVYIYIGIVGPGRGVEMLLETFARANTKSHVVFLGFGVLEDDIRRHSESHSNIHFHPRVAHEQVVPIAQSADFGLCMIQNISLSDYYCLPNKLFEYLFSGLPVIASRFPDMEKLVDDYQVGRTCEPTAEALAATLGELEASREPFEFQDLMPLSWQAQKVKLVAFYQTLFAR